MHGAIGKEPGKRHGHDPGHLRVVMGRAGRAGQDLIEYLVLALNALMMTKSIYSNHGRF